MQSVDLKCVLSNYSASYTLMCALPEALGQARYHLPVPVPWAGTKRRNWHPLSNFKAFQMSEH